MLEKTSDSWLIYFLATSTKFGIKSYLLFSITSKSANAVSALTDITFNPLYTPIT